MPRTPEDIAADQVEAIRRYADALAEAQACLNKTTHGASAEFDALIDLQVYPDDMGDLGKRVKAIADAWQAQIDALLDASEEAADLGRANHLEPDYRRAI